MENDVAASANPSSPEAQILFDYRPRGRSGDDILEAFLSAMIDRGVELYPAQEEAILEICAGKNVILNTPTGSGKSLVALAMHFKAICEGKRTFYTCPIKALVSEKFFALCKEFGPENVGMMTGDASINKSAPVLCCTAEILSNMALREGKDAVIDSVVMDEFHYFSDRERGMAWQVPLLTLPQTTFLLMSATLGDTSSHEGQLRKLTQKDVVVVRSEQRPVPLDYRYAETPLHETLHELIGSGRYPIYLVNFTQRECAEAAQSLMSVNFCTKEEKERIKEAVGGFRFDSPYGREMKRFVLHGLGLHHAGLLPKYRLLVEQLSQRGLLKVIAGTDTLGVGVNVPIRTVLFTKLCKYDGEKTTLLSVRDFKQIAGRAGRKGFDEEGSVVCQAPEHVIENKRAENRYDAQSDKKKRKVVKKQPPTKGYVHYDDQTFRRLIESPAEALESRFAVDHGILINLLMADDGPVRGYRRLVELIGDSLEKPKEKTRHRKRAALLFRSLRGAGLLSVERSVRSGRREIVLSPDLQRDFSLHQTLSLYLIEALAYLSPDDENYAYDLLTLVESILESPRVILLKQIDKCKGERIAELKAEGVEYEQRMEELEKVDHPKPLADFVYQSFHEFSSKHPWVGSENIRPKSITREMYERYASFSDYIKEYGLQRSEGILLRYLSQSYKVLVQTVPEAARTEAVLDCIAWLRTTLGRVDTSLVEEWESLLAPSDDHLGAATAPSPRSYDPQRDPRAFTARVRAEAHRVVKALADGDYEEASALLRADDDDRWDALRLEGALAPFLEEYERLVFDVSARQPPLTRLQQEPAGRWRVTQTLCDPSGDNLWMLEALVRPPDRGAEDEPWLQLVRIGY
ncbi:MAG: DEAD/DEAH box helicase [Myxococcota bacterium]